MKKTFITAVFLLMLGVIPAASQDINFTDNFDDGNIDGWDVFDAIGGILGEPYAEVTYPDGGVRLRSPATPDPAIGPGAAAIRMTDLVFADFEMSIDILEDNSTDGGVFGINARMQSPFVGYILGAGPTGPDELPPGESGTTAFFLTRLDGPGVPQVSQEAVFFDLPEGVEQLQMVFSGTGGLLTGRLFDLNDLSAPLVTVSGEDTTYSSGYAEFFAASGVPPEGLPFFDSSGDATFDNFTLAATIPEPSSATLALISVGVGLSVLRRRR